MNGHTAFFGTLAIASLLPVLSATAAEPVAVWQCAPSRTLDCTSGACKPASPSSPATADRTITFSPAAKTLSACFGTDQCLSGPTVIVRSQPGRYYSVWSKPTVKGKAWKAPNRVTAFFHRIKGGGHQFVMVRSDDIVLSGSCIQR